MTRDDVIRECIQRIKDRPGWRAITTLEAMLKPEPAKTTKPTANHPWRKFPKELQMQNLGDNPLRRKP